MKTIDERFWSKVEKTDTCWLWTGGAIRKGYGAFAVTRDHMVSAHRWSYERWHGPIPPGLHLDHLCRVTACVNPAHLEAVTPRTNVLRGIGSSAKNAKKTHCLRGHEFTADNTHRGIKGERVCKSCWSVRARRDKARRAAGSL